MLFGDFECAALEIPKKKFRVANEFLQRTRTHPQPHSHTAAHTHTHTHTVIHMQRNAHKYDNPLGCIHMENRVGEASGQGGEWETAIAFGCGP